MNISVVVPVYNGQQTIVELTERLAKVLPGISEAHEVIFICDGSPDDSWKVIRQLAARFDFVRGLNLMRNSGQENAVLCGIRAARYEVTVTMDDDLQHPPEQIPLLVRKLSEDADVVFGISKKRPQSWWRTFFASITKRILSRVMGIKEIRDLSSFRALRTDLRKAFETYNSSDVFVDVLLSWGTQRFAAVQVDLASRTVGESNYNLSKLAHVAVLVLTSFSTAPLRFASIIGFLFTVLGFLGFLYVIAIYFIEGSIPGFPFLATTIMLFSGAQLFALGIIGEYLGRVFERTSHRPPYIVGQAADDPE